MSDLSKRDLLAAIAALAAAAAAPNLAQAQAALDLSAGRAIGEAYRSANPAIQPGALRQDLLPDGLNAAALARLRARIAEDFRAGRVFIHRGWRLSRTEAQLFAILAG